MQQGGKVLHYIQKNEFVDSPEWDALKDNNKGIATFNVSYILKKLILFELS